MALPVHRSVRLIPFSSPSQPVGYSLKRRQATLRLGGYWQIANTPPVRAISPLLGSIRPLCASIGRRQYAALSSVACRRSTLPLSTLPSVLFRIHATAVGVAKRLFPRPPPFRAPLAPGRMPSSNLTPLGKRAVFHFPNRTPFIGSPSDSLLGAPATSIRAPIHALSAHGGHARAFRLKKPLDAPCARRRYGTFDRAVFCFLHSRRSKTVEKLAAAASEMGIVYQTP